MQLTHKLPMSGNLAVRKVGAVVPAPIEWKLKNNLRPGFIKGWIAKHAVVPLANAFGVATMLAELELKHRKWHDPIEAAHFLALLKAGKQVEAEEYAKTRTYIVDYGVVCYRVITDAGVAFLVDDWDNNGQDLTTMNYHGCGTGTNAEAVGDTALQTESTTILNPDSTRATGTRAQPAANQYRSTGTVTFDGAGAITEHGLLSQAATGGGSLWDRSVFSALNVVSADSIIFQYTCTVSSGG